MKHQLMGQFDYPSHDWVQLSVLTCRITFLRNEQFRHRTHPTLMLVITGERTSVLLYAIPYQAVGTSPHIHWYHFTHGGQEASH